MMKKKSVFDRMEDVADSNKTWGVLVALWVGAMIVNLALVGFGVWVVVQILQHFGII